MHAIQDGKFSGVYIPYYLCDTVQKALEKNDINIKFFNISKNLLPIIDEEMSNNLLNNNYCLVLVNYFSNIPRKILNDYYKKYKNIIIDNTQSFFCKPIIDCYNVYSCRKFFGVPDGAYLIKKSINKTNIKANKISYNTNFLVSSIEFGTNKLYKESLENEDRINNESVSEMSDITDKIMKSIDYKYVKKRRKQNLLYINKYLNKYNEISILNKSNTYMIYPFLIKDDGLRKYLIDNKVWVSQWWKLCLENKNCNEYEKYLSKYLLPIPIDQRYDLSDMKYLCEMILSYLENKKENNND